MLPIARILEIVCRFTTRKPDRLSPAFRAASASHIVMNPAFARALASQVGFFPLPTIVDPSLARNTPVRPVKVRVDPFFLVKVIEHSLFLFFAKIAAASLGFI